MGNEWAILNKKYKQTLTTEYRNVVRVPNPKLAHAVAGEFYRQHVLLAVGHQAGLRGERLKLQLFCCGPVNFNQGSCSVVPATAPAHTRAIRPIDLKWASSVACCWGGGLVLGRSGTQRYHLFYIVCGPVSCLTCHLLPACLAADLS